MNIGLKPIALALLLAATFPVGVANAKVPEKPGAHPAPAPAVKVSNSGAPTTRQAPQRDVTDAAAVGSWARKGYQETSGELKAAAHGLENAAGWVGGEAKAGASTTVAGMRALRERLISGAVNARDEVDKGFAALDRGVGELNGKTGGTKQAPSDKAPS